MNILDTIATLHRQLDANPEEHNLRGVLADALEEAGEGCAEMAPGYRALCELRRNPHGYASNDWGWWHKHDTSINDGRDYLPPEWFKLIPTGSRGNNQFRTFPSRREAEDAAAKAFSQLPALVRAELLSSIFSAEVGGR